MSLEAIHLHNAFDPKDYPFSLALFNLESEIEKPKDDQRCRLFQCIWFNFMKNSHRLLQQGLFIKRPALIPKVQERSTHDYTYAGKPMYEDDVLVDKSVLNMFRTDAVIFF